MKITVEFTGVARTIAHQKTIELSLDETTTYQDIIRELARRYPALIGIIIDPDGETFLSSNMFIINGNMTTPAMVIQERAHDGDHLILMALVTGGTITG